MQLHENEILNTKTFEDLDNLIINNSNIDNEKLTVDSIYSEHTWYLEYKLESAVLKSILNNFNQIKCFKFKVDDIVKCICCLFNYTKRKIKNENKTYFRIPDRYLCERLECSRDRLIILIDFLYRIGIIELNKLDIIPKIKLNLKYVENDKYIFTKCKSFWTTDITTIRNLEIQKNTLYYYNYNSKVFKNKEKEIKLGMTIAYAVLLQNSNKAISFREDTKDNNSILYCEFPIHIISKQLNCSESKAYKGMIDLFEHTDYIKKHNLVYSDVKFNNKEHQKEYISNPEHFLNSNYKSFAKNKYYKMNDIYGNSYEENHPRVTKTSVIIFTDKFKKSKIGKKVIKNLEVYKDLVKYQLLNKYYNEDFYKDNIIINNETNNVNNLTCFDKEYIESNDPLQNAFNKLEDRSLANNIVNGSTDEDGNKIEPSGRIINLDHLSYEKHFNLEHYRKRIKLYGKEDQRSIESLIKLYITVSREVINCMSKDLNYYCNFLKHLQQIITDKLNKWVFNHFNYSDSNKYGSLIYNSLTVIKQYDENYGIQIYNNILTNIKETAQNSEWFNTIYNNKYEQTSIDNLINLKELSKYSSDTTVKKEIYDNGISITDNLPKLEDVWSLI